VVAVDITAVVVAVAVETQLVVVVDPATWVQLVSQM
jgi:hypothetical protein